MQFFILALYFDGCHWIENCLFSVKEIAHMYLKKVKDTYCLHIRYTWGLQNAGYQLCVLIDGNTFNNKSVKLNYFKIQTTAAMLLASKNVDLIFVFYWVIEKLLSSLLLGHWCAFTQFAVFIYIFTLIQQCALNARPPRIEVIRTTSLCFKIDCGLVDILADAYLLPSCVVVFLVDKSHSL